MIATEKRRCDFPVRSSLVDRDDAEQATRKAARKSDALRASPRRGQPGRATPGRGSAPRGETQILEREPRMTTLPQKTEEKQHDTRVANKEKRNKEGE